MEMRVLLVLLLAEVLWTQSVKYSVVPDATYNLSQASPSACYADCLSCQTLTNQCQDCFAPYFSKAQDGSCDLTSTYTLESSNNEVRAGQAFIYAAESWGNITQTDCSPDPQFLTAALRILGPFSAGSVLYQRSVSFHQYLVLTFQLIKMGWDNSSLLTVTLLDQSNAVLAARNITPTPLVPQQKLCSATQIDQRFAVEFTVADRSVTTLSVRFDFAGKGAWGMATWALISGTCDSSCSNCSYSSDPTQCIGCNAFFITGSDNKCSQCYPGFALSLLSSVQVCLKCPIEFQNCNPGQQVCYYSSLAGQLNSTDCTFTDTSDYTSTYDVNSLTFPGSLFTVQGKPATYQCGIYSVVGLAQSGDSITRVFAALPQHYTVSISFNIFVVDQSKPTRNNLFVIILDNVILEASYIVTEGVSDLCGSTLLEAFVTYPPTIFYSHNNTFNVNLTITSNATNWGIRNLRIAQQICDTTCLNCGQVGCEECQGYFTLSGMVCADCPAGFGVLKDTNGTNTCVQCTENCLSCLVSNVNGSTVTTCLKCSLAYFLFQQNCVKRTNVADILAVSSTPPDPLWATISSNSSTGNSSSGGLNITCSINLPSRSNTSTVNFTVSQNKMTSLLSIKQPHYRKIVQFYLIKIDSWESTDLLQLYLNDLLVLSKNYSTFGNSICYSSNETDLISYQAIQIDDDNSSLSVSFEVVSKVGSIRRFGVADFRVSPVGCADCQSYPFGYRIEYNYDNSLNVHVEFNRIYVNTNATLFAEIFWLLVNGRKVDYSVVWNNSVTYILQSFPGDTLNANLTLICNYPELVKTDTLNTVNQSPFFTARLLQSGAYATLKIVDNNSSYAELTRYTPPSSPDSVNGMRIFFEVVSRAVIYVGFAAFFFGCQTSCTHFMHNLQKIWLHIFVAALAAPSALRYALIGFRETQGQNIAINPSSWESGLPYELYYNTPSYFEQYYTDVGFFRNIYNIAVAFLILGIVAIVMNLLLGKCDVSRNFKDNIFWRHMRVTFVKRPFFVLNSILFYQYLSLVIACALQFTALKNSTNQGAFGGLNAAGAVVAFILATIYPLFHLYYLRRQQASLQEHKVQFTNRYGEIFYRFLPRDVWLQQKPGVTYAQMIYNVYRWGQMWWLCLVAVGLHGNPQGQCYLLMITNFLHLVVVLFSRISQTLYFKLCKVFELALFAGLEILILVCESQQATLTSRSLDTLGAVGIAIVFCIVTLSLIRSIYTFYRIYREYQPDLDHNKYASIKTRNEDYFTVKEEEPIVASERD